MTATDGLTLGQLRRELAHLVSLADSAERPKPSTTNPGEDFTPMTPTDARRLAMALLAAADRADHLTRGVPRLEDRKPA